MYARQLCYHGATSPARCETLVFYRVKTDKVVFRVVFLNPTPLRRELALEISEFMCICFTNCFFPRLTWSSFYLCTGRFHEDIFIQMYRVLWSKHFCPLSCIILFLFPDSPALTFMLYINDLYVILD